MRAFTSAIGIFNDDAVKILPVLLFDEVAGMHILVYECRIIDGNPWTLPGPSILLEHQRGSSIYYDVRVRNVSSA